MASAGIVNEPQVRPAAGRGLGFRPDIEGLRGLAILGVVAYHAELPGVSGGFVGVDIFFALSGYLITSLLLKELDTRGRISLTEFYARRVRRLLPAGALTLVLTILAAVAIFSPREITFAGRAGRAAALNLSNVFFATNAADYFGPRVELNPVLHTWSLSVEEQFYLVWPLLIVITAQWARSARALRIGLLALTAVSFVMCVLFTYRGGTFAFYQLPARAWEFGLGGLAAIAAPQLGRVAEAGGWAAACVLLGSILVTAPSASFPGWIAAIPVAATCVVLIACAQRGDGPLARVLSVAPLQSLGRLSYSWYLWHWPVLVFTAALMPEAGWPVKTLAGMAALGLAAVTFALVEHPVRSHPALSRRPVASLAMGAALAVLMFVASQGALQFAGWLGSTPYHRQIAAAAADIASLPREQCVTLGQSDAVKTCSFGDANAATDVVLFGDSHAIQYFDAVAAIARERGWHLTTMFKSGCAAAGVGGTGPGSDCGRWREAAIRQIAAEAPEAVVMASANNLPDATTAEHLLQVRQGTRATVAALAAAGVPALVIRDNPRFPFDVLACLGRGTLIPWSPDESCDAEVDESLDPRVFDAERAGANGYGRVAFVDLTSRICPDGVCRGERGGRLVYRDDNHLTGTFAATLAPDIERQLRHVLSR